MEEIKFIDLPVERLRKQLKKEIAQVELKELIFITPVDFAEYVENLIQTAKNDILLKYPETVFDTGFYLTPAYKNYNYDPNEDNEHTIEIRFNYTRPETDAEFESRTEQEYQELNKEAIKRKWEIIHEREAEEKRIKKAKIEQAKIDAKDPAIIARKREERRLKKLLTTV